MINSKDYDFSFSGLKTAVLYSSQKKNVKAMCYEIQQAIIDVLIKKTIKATKDYRAKTLILGGGVTANKELRKQFKNKAKNINLQIPDIKYSTDNAVMTAVAGYFRYKNGKRESWQNIEANANLRLK
jgi:N6-L-threonylcarbamoyladenine synthase